MQCGQQRSDPALRSRLTAERKTIFISELREFARHERLRRQAESMTREQLAAFDGLGRLRAGRLATIEGLVRYSRENPRSDVTMALFVLIAALSDNDDGCCTLSIARMAALFARDRRNVTVALSRLDAAGVISREERTGETMRCWPVVHRSFGQAGPQPIWLVDAHSPPSVKRGRPAKTPDDNITPFSAKPLTSASPHFDNTPDVDVIPFRGKPLTSTSPNPTKGEDDEEEGERGGSDASASQEGDVPASSWEERLETARCAWLNSPDARSDVRARHETVRFVRQQIAIRTTGGRVPELCNQAMHEAGCDLLSRAPGLAGASRTNERFRSYLGRVFETRLSRLEEAQRERSAHEAIASEVVVARRSHTYPEAFEAFWSAYPDRTNNSKPKALEAWKRLTLEQQNQATVSLSNFAQFLRDRPDHPCIHAERYLKHHRFEGFLAAPPPPKGGRDAGSGPHPPASQRPRPYWWRNNPNVKHLTPERWRKAINEWANGTWPVDVLGPVPGTEGCLIPEDLIQEMRLTDVYTEKGIKRA